MSGRRWVVAAVLGLGGCGGEGAGGETVEEPAASEVRETAGDDAIVAVFLTEYTIDMPATLVAGPTTISVTNQGVEDHNLRIMPRGSEDIVWQTDGNVEPNLTQETTIDLAAGTYLAVCDFAGHDSRGMYLEIEVREPGS